MEVKELHTCLLSVIARIIGDARCRDEDDAAHTNQGWIIRHQVAND